MFRIQHNLIAKTRKSENAKGKGESEVGEYSCFGIRMPKPALQEPSPFCSLFPIPHPLSPISRFRHFALSRLVCFVLVVALLMSIALSCMAQTPSGYVIGPEDVINVSVERHSEFSGEFYIPADGSVDLPAAGVVQMSGKTLVQIAESITDRLRTRLRKPQVTVTLKTPRRRQVNILGAVLRPGAYETKPGWRCDEVIAAAGGLADNLQPTECKASIRRSATGAVEEIDLGKAISGINDSNPTIESGDVISIDAPEMVAVYVVGKVKNPGLYRVRKDSASVTQAIAAAGGELDNSAMTHLTITHASGSSETVDMASDAKRVDALKLQAMDMIMVPEETARAAVFGYVNEPGFFQLKSTQPMSLINIISQAKGPDRRANISSVAVIRTENGKQQRLLYNLHKFLGSGDISQNPTIKSGDVVYVPQTGKPNWNEVLGSAAALALVVNPFL